MSAERQVGAFLNKSFKQPPSPPIRRRPLGVSLDKLCGLVPSRRFFFPPQRRDEPTLDCVCNRCGRCTSLYRTERGIARVDVSRWADRAEVESGHWGLFVERTVNHEQHEYAVLHRSHGSRRLPAEKFLHIVPVVAAERGQLARQARQ